MAIKNVLLALLALAAVVSGFAPASPCSCLANEAQFEAFCESGAITDPDVCAAELNCHWGPDELTECHHHGPVTGNRGPLSVAIEADQPAFQADQGYIKI